MKQCCQTFHKSFSSRKFLDYIVTRAFETGRKSAYLLFPKREEKEKGKERNTRT